MQIVSIPTLNKNHSSVSRGGVGWMTFRIRRYPTQLNISAIESTRVSMFNTGILIGFRLSRYPPA